MAKFKAMLGYLAAGTTVCVAALVPFVLYGAFTNGFAHLGLHVDEMYSGGPVARSIQTNGYTIEVHRLVTPHLLQNERPFVEVDWHPASALPMHVEEMVDIDGDGKADVLVSFDVPRPPKAELHADITSLNPIYANVQRMGKEKFSALIIRVDDKIIVRVPVVKKND